LPIFSGKVSKLAISRTPTFTPTGTYQLKNTSNVVRATSSWSAGVPLTFNYLYTNNYKMTDSVFTTHRDLSSVASCYTYNYYNNANGRNAARIDGINSYVPRNYNIYYNDGSIRAHYSNSASIANRFLFNGLFQIYQKGTAGARKHVEGTYISKNTSVINQDVFTGEFIRRFYGTNNLVSMEIYYHNPYKNISSTTGAANYNVGSYYGLSYALNVGYGVVSAVELYSDTNHIKNVYTAGSNLKIKGSRELSFDEGITLAYNANHAVKFLWDPASGSTEVYPKIS